LDNIGQTEKGTKVVYRRYF